ncbi:hypothetical protein HUJ04_010105 [Dendroctonus ponderosae]
MAPYHWVTITTRGASFPSSAVPAGTDIDGAPIYVGRSFFNGDWLPAKVIPSKHVAYISYGGKEISVDKFKVLCEQRFEWIPAENGHVPVHSVVGGKTASGEELFIGRVRHQGSQTVGKVHPSHKTCYIAFGGKEIAYKQYEVLVLQKP